MRRSTVRHVPEDELHAYLDQALSRSQCIEIETHLAGCPACRESRDTIAGLRDRTTAMLDLVAPRRSPPPPFATLAARAAARPRRTWHRPAIWAASFAGALLAGWSMRSVFDARGAAASPALLTADPIEVPVPSTIVATGDTGAASHTLALTPAPSTSLELRSRGPSAGDMEIRQAVGADPAPPLQVSPPETAVVPTALSLDSRWTSVTLVEAEQATSGLVPLIPDLPVVEIQMRPGGAQERPLLVVTQRHGSGVLVHTVEGPVEEVAGVVGAQLGPNVRLGSSDVQRSTPDYVEAGPSFSRTQRVLVLVARLPADTLNQLAGSVVLR